MSKGLLTHTLGFEILPTNNDKIIVFLDTSDYFEAPDLPSLMIHPPGFKKFFQVNINYGKINIISSHTMGWTDVLEASCELSLPDGVWKYTYMICPYTELFLTRLLLRTNQLDSQLYCIYSYLDLECELEDKSSCIKKELIDIHLLIESAKANCELGKIDKGEKDFSLAQKKVKSLFDKVTKE